MPFLFSTMLVKSDIIMKGLHISHCNDFVRIILQDTGFLKNSRHFIVTNCLFFNIIEMISSIFTSQASHISLLRLKVAIEAKLFPAVQPKKGIGEEKEILSSCKSIQLAKTRVGLITNAITLYM